MQTFHKSVKNVNGIDYNNIACKLICFVTSKLSIIRYLVRRNTSTYTITASYDLVTKLQNLSFPRPRRDSVM